MGIGGFFLLLGIAAIIWDRREARGYYDNTSTHNDVREYLEHWPPRPALGALKIGGWIAIAIGLLLLIIGGALLALS
jgi:hypothetical protein